MTNTVKHLPKEAKRLGLVLRPPPAGDIQRAKVGHRLNVAGSCSLAEPMVPRMFTRYDRTARRDKSPVAAGTSPARWRNLRCPAHMSRSEGYWRLAFRAALCALSDQAVEVCGLAGRVADNIGQGMKLAKRLQEGRLRIRKIRIDNWRHFQNIEPFPGSLPFAILARSAFF
jgi:hypothetical protein